MDPTPAWCDHRPVSALTIRCDIPSRATRELERWLAAQLKSLEELFPSTTANLARLDGTAADRVHREGRLITMDLADPGLAGHARFEKAIGDLLRDLRFLGITATVLAPAPVPAGERDLPAIGVR
jgi:hypothetical protein